MKIGMNMLLWTGHVAQEHFALFPKLKAVGFDGIEIPVFDASDPGHYRAMAAAAHAEGLECNAITILTGEEVNAISPEAAHRAGALDHMKRVIDCARELGSEVLAGPYFQVLGQFTGAGPTERELEWAAELHRPVAALAEQAGMVCALEPLNRFEAHLINTMEQAAAYVQRVGHPNFGAMYDSFHANIEEQDVIGCINTLHAVGGLRNVHISENDRGTPGRGHVPIPQAIARLKSLGYDGWLTIEAFGRGVPELAAATRVWRAFFPNPEQVYTEGYRLIRDSWDRA
jgi:D-psicose/D-tagatose/L-ribulose 3-epimerase